MLARMGSATTKPAIHPADRCRARRQRVCPGRDRRRISVRLAVDDRGERRNLCMCARAARAQSPRSTPNRCVRIIGITIAISCPIRTKRVSDGPAVLLVSRALRLVRGLRCESSRPSPAPALASHPRFPSAPAALRRLRSLRGRILLAVDREFIEKITRFVPRLGRKLRQDRSQMRHLVRGTLK